MMNNENILGIDYLSGSTTSFDVQDIDISKDNIDISKYIIDKPKRIIIKTKIIK